MIAKLPAKLKLLIVSKGRRVDEILRVLSETGATRIGENRLEEAEMKFPLLPAALEKHFIGKLQSRKIRRIVEVFDVIQSVENVEQAQKISTCSVELGKTVSIFLEVNLSGLPQRSGASLPEAPGLLEQLSALPNVQLIGVMGMATPNPEEARAQFRLLKTLQGNLPECSMGMSDDYPIAIEEGATILRLGQVLFEKP